MRSFSICYRFLLDCEVVKTHSHKIKNNDNIVFMCGRFKIVMEPTLLIPINDYNMYHKCRIEESKSSLNAPWWIFALIGTFQRWCIDFSSTASVYAASQCVEIYHTIFQKTNALFPSKVHCTKQMFKKAGWGRDNNSLLVLTSFSKATLMSLSLHKNASKGGTLSFMKRSS